MINNFRGENFFLSNFYCVPITYNGITYQNSEAAFQAQKTTDKTLQLQFSPLNPLAAKHLGRNIPLRKDWENIKIQVMNEIVEAKFRQNPFLLEKLIDTGNEYLEEGNHWGDKTWGTVGGVGSNYLGQILMNVRDKLSKELVPENNMEKE